MGVWDIDMRSFTIIFKAADLVGGPAEDRATIGIKVNLMVPAFDYQNQRETGETR